MINSISSSHAMHDARRVAGQPPVSLETVSPAIEIRYHDGAAQEEKAETAEKATALAACRLLIRVLPNTTSGEHKFKVTALIVTSNAEDGLGLDDVAHFVDMSSRSDYAEAAGRG